MIEEEPACFLCGRAFGTELTDLGEEEGMEEGEDVGGVDVGEEAWRWYCLLCHPGQH